MRAVITVVGKDHIRRNAQKRKLLKSLEISSFQVVLIIILKT